MKLRRYQIESVHQIRAHFKAKRSRVILCSPTGSGKTVVFCHIAKKTLEAGNSSCIVVDRKELLDQTVEKLRLNGIEPQVIQGKRKVDYSRGGIYVATVQTLFKRPQPEVNLLVLDEAHKQTFDKLLEMPCYNNTYVIGATATPHRTGKMTQLSDLYNTMVEPVKISQLIAAGFLLKNETYAPIEAKEIRKGIKVTAGEYNSKAMFEAFNTDPLYEGLVDQFKTHGSGKTICYCVNVEHSMKTMEHLNRAGIPSIHLDGKDPKSKRETILQGWRDGLWQVLCNCDLFTVGFDEPAIETVIVNRATKSLPLWLQMCGRGSRPFGELESFTTIDMAGNVYAHGLWSDEREFSLTHEYKPGKGLAPVKDCPKCELIVHAAVMVCPECSYRWPRKKVETPVSEFERVQTGGPMPSRLADKPFKEMTVQELMEFGYIKGYSPKWVEHQIKVQEDPFPKFQLFGQIKGYKRGYPYFMMKKYDLTEKV